jgi:hypothetical protein
VHLDNVKEIVAQASKKTVNYQRNVSGLSFLIALRYSLTFICQFLWIILFDCPSVFSNVYLPGQETVDIGYEEDEEKQNKNTTQYVLETTIRK